MGKNGRSRFGLVTFTIFCAGFLASAQTQTSPTQEDIIQGVKDTLSQTTDKIDPTGVLKERRDRIAKAQAYLTDQLKTTTDSNQTATLNRALSVLAGIKLLLRHSCQLTINTYPAQNQPAQEIRVSFNADQVSSTVGARFEQDAKGVFQFVDKFSAQPQTTKISLTFYDFLDQIKNIPMRGVFIEGVEPSTTPKSSSSRLIGQGFASDDAGVASVFAFGTRAAYAVRCDRRAAPNQP